MSSERSNAVELHRYNAASANEIEAKWQQYWRDQNTFRAPNPGEVGFDPTKRKQYILDMFPFPSGAGLHVGHPRGYIATDVYARFQRMSGYNVLHAMGFDAFGLPAEQFAVETGTHPQITTEQNIAAIRNDLARLGLAHDSRRSVSTTDVSYYKWTQWIFLQIFNSWYDTKAGKARPIAELIGEFERGDRSLDDHADFKGRKWADLSELEQHLILGRYRLAYLDEVPVNWCPALGTVLANEEVTIDGRSERGNHPVYKRPLKQWMMRITAYADRLIDDLTAIDWPESVKAMQANWIGRSVGAKVSFKVEHAGGAAISVFTTRPDTLFGATYIVLAPEHPLVEQITADAQREEIRRYGELARNLSDTDRSADKKQKSGVFTGAHAVNPVNNDRIPIWISDYVMMGYGTGAIMAVPAHDERDFQFAKTFNLPIHAVVMPDDSWLAESYPNGAANHSPDDLRAQYLAGPEKFLSAFVAEGTSVNSKNQSTSLNGLATAQAKEGMIEWLRESGVGDVQVQYKLHDWLFSRQRYWGEPIPLLYAPNGEVRAVDEADLPIRLPEMDDFRPETSDDPDRPPMPPLSRAPASWRIVERDGVKYVREVNTMPQWAGSCWYYLRYLDPDNDREFCGPEAERYWLGDGSAQRGGVDLYVGGVEHAVLHLLYARFWHKILYDLGHVSTIEPFSKLYNQGYVLAMAFRDERGIYVPASEVTDEHGQEVKAASATDDRKYFFDGKPVTAEFGKMGKSLKNGVSPHEICANYGADTLRLYELSMGPLSASQAWNPHDIVGLYRFLARLWRNLIDEMTGQLRVVDTAADKTTMRLLSGTIAKVRGDVERLAFHTAIAKMIEFNNHLTKLDYVTKGVARELTLLLAPFAPHIAEELWQRLGGTNSLAYERYPVADETLLQEVVVELPIAVSGKTRFTISISPDASREEAEEAARQDERIKKMLQGKAIAKVIYVPGRMLNFVISH